MNLHSLKAKRVHDNLIVVLKWAKEFNKGDVSKVFMVNDQVMTRGNKLMLDKFRFTQKIGKNWFTNRVVDKWNRFSSGIISANTIDRKLDEKVTYIDGYG